MEFIYIAIIVIVAVRFFSKRSTTPPPTKVACATCGYDIRATPERCPECGTAAPRLRRPLDPAKLRDDWPLTPIEPRKPGVEEMLVRVWDAPNGWAATLLIEQFRARGITATIQRRLMSMQIGNYIAPPSDFTVNVWSEDVDAAEAVMDRLALDAAP